MFDFFRRFSHEFMHEFTSVFFCQVTFTWDFLEKNFWIKFGISLGNFDGGLFGEMLGDLFIYFLFQVFSVTYSHRSFRFSNYTGNSGLLIGLALVGRILLLLLVRLLFNILLRRRSHNGSLHGSRGGLVVRRAMLRNSNCCCSGIVVAVLLGFVWGSNGVIWNLGTSLVAKVSNTNLFHVFKANYSVFIVV